MAIIVEIGVKQANKEIKQCLIILKQIRRLLCSGQYRGMCKLQLWQQNNSQSDLSDYNDYELVTAHAC
jgi:hypothetical protein